ncbi:MAG TPA: substrate-binding domain-containing protein, partial [Fimbriimonadaceae bacterium]|nr:substrate-binding domain-containing protein [Fimbriimonadaceae bacterium]
MAPNTMIFRGVLGLAVSALFVAGLGCAPSGEAGKAQAGLTGKVQIDGSSTVEPVLSAMAEQYRNQEPGVSVQVGTSGTGGGFKKFVQGEIDIANASRVIESSEIAQAQQNGIEFVELPIAFDGLTVVVHPS